LAAVLILILSPTIGGLLQMALSRTREFDADLGAAMLTGDPDGLASALIKLETAQRRHWEAMMLPGGRIPDPSLLRTHPPTDQRVARLMSLKARRETSPSVLAAPPRRRHARAVRAQHPALIRSPPDADIRRIAEMLERMPVSTPSTRTRPASDQPAATAWCQPERTATLPHPARRCLVVANSLFNIAELAQRQTDTLGGSESGDTDMELGLYTFGDVGTDPVTGAMSDRPNG
jgi:heat shock protein HtpX